MKRKEKKKHVTYYAFIIDFDLDMEQQREKSIALCNIERETTKNIVYLSLKTE